MKKDEGKTKEKVETAVLSTTAKVKARNERKNKAEGNVSGVNEDSAMNDASLTPSKADQKADGDADMTDANAADKKEEEEKKEKEEEPDTQVLKNPSRVLKA